MTQTPKDRVLKEFPAATCYKDSSPTTNYVVVLSASRVKIYANGKSPRLAWHHAATKMFGVGN